MPHHGGRTELICGLGGMGADFQHLAERAQFAARGLGGFIAARIGDDHDPQGVAPAAVAVGGKNAGNAFSDGRGVVAREDDDPDRLDLRC